MQNIVNIDKIRGLMAERKVNGLEMASHLGISQTAFYMKINGKREFSSNELGLIAKVLNTTPNFFYNLCYLNSNKEV